MVKAEFLELNELGFEACVATDSLGDLGHLILLL